MPSHINEAPAYDEEKLYLAAKLYEDIASKRDVTELDMIVIEQSVFRTVAPRFKKAS